MKGLNALLDVNELNLGVFTESWITNNSDIDCIQKQCFPLGFHFYSAPRVKKEQVEFASFTDMISIWKVLKSLPLIFMSAGMSR